MTSDTYSGECRCGSLDVCYRVEVSADRGFGWVSVDRSEPTIVKAENEFGVNVLQTLPPVVLAGVVRCVERHIEKNWGDIRSQILHSLDEREFNGRT